MNLPSKLPCEIYDAAPGADGKNKLLSKFVLTGFDSYDDALKRALRRVGKERKVESANFRAGKDGTPSAIVVYAR